MTKTIDALVARDRLLAELAGMEDRECAMQLWRAAKRYNERAKTERGGWDHPATAPLAPAMGGNGGGEAW